MATQVIGLNAPTALATPTIRVFADGSDTQVSGSPFTLVEATNRKGYYEVSFTGTLAGLHQCIFYTGSSPIGWGWVTLANASATYVVASDRGVNVSWENQVSNSAITTIKAVQGLAVDGVVPTVTTVTNQLTAAQVATGIWQDATAGDFTTANSVGKSLYNAFTANTSVFTTAALVNAPAVSGAAVATAVWQDTTAGDFTVAGSIGKSLFTAGIVPGASAGLALVSSVPTAAQNADALLLRDAASGAVASVAGHKSVAYYLQGGLPNFNMTTSPGIILGSDGVTTVCTLTYTVAAVDPIITGVPA